MMYLKRCERLSENCGHAVLIVHQWLEHLQCMDDARNVTQYRQKDIDEEVGIATALEEDTKGRKDDGEDDLADVARVKTSSTTIFMYSSTGTFWSRARKKENSCGGKRNDCRRGHRLKSSKLTLQ